MNHAPRLAAAALITMVVGAAAEDNRAPATFTIGYEEEGKVDASPEACRAFVTETVDWDKAETKQAVHDVCAARKRHVEAYAALQTNYTDFAKAFDQDVRLDVATAVRSLGAMIKSCMDFKMNLTTGGHNIAIDIIPNDIAASCLSIGAELLEAETKRYRGP
jgi:hypothetical protein